MKVYLVQHGISLPKESDPEKGLSVAGIEQTKLIAGVAENYQIRVKQILHSGKTRALQTARIFFAALKPEKPLVSIKGIGPMDDVQSFRTGPDSLDHAMIVGHLPFMQRLLSLLVCDDADRMVYRFQNSGIVCLEREDGNWFIKWTLNPEVS